MMHELDDYLERRGAKYFVTLTVICYVLGTFIFNVYLYSLNISEFELLKLRYMFVGITFVLITALFPAFYFLFKKIQKFLQLVNKERIKKESDKPTKRSVLVEIILYVLFIPWVWVYSLHVFPTIPAAFGGSAPEVARLIGDPETIKQLNELIAYETGIAVDDLPFELAAQNSSLAVGANVKILDRNTDRFILILTKDLYLSSTSSIAKKLLESGELASLEDEIEIEFFDAKPIYFSAENIRGTTATLYEPSAVTTQNDLQIAAKVVAQNPNTAPIVEKVIAEDLPEAAPKIIAAVQKKVAEKKAADAGVPTNTTDPVKDDSAVEQQDIDQILESTVDWGFLDFRAQIFAQAGELFDKEKRGERKVNDRKDLVKAITGTFTSTYPVAWQQFSGAENYLITGQDDKEFPRKIQEVFQGVDSPEQIVTRLNALQPPVVDDFIPTIEGAKLLFENSSQENVEYNRKLVSGVLVRHFTQKARQYTEYWNDPKYLHEGAVDDEYFANIRTLFAEATNWEDLRDRLTAYQAALEAKNPTTPEPQPEEVTEEEAPTDETQTEETPPVEETVTEEPVTEESTTEETPSVDPPAEENPPTETPVEGEASQDETAEENPAEENNQPTS